MTETSSNDPKKDRNEDAAQHVAEAHRILNGLRQELEKHSDLESAIANLEMALSILTTKTAGML